ncbi:MAG: ATP-binding protein, partial [Pseudomonadota bacterium]
MSKNKPPGVVTEMQFLRIRVENWRAVVAREITFGNGVNIVEGANEAGKSSFIEALNLLFRERDSSKKKEIRSIAPKGHDVGSTVLLEFKSGDYHLTYQKTFNRRPATSLLMHAPEILQFTGLAAHEKVQSILESTIDFGLWQALQLEQGAEFAHINLRHSGGLAASPVPAPPAALSSAA